MVPQFRASLEDLCVAPQLPESARTFAATDMPAVVDSELQQDRLRFFFPARDDEYGRSGSEWVSE